MLFCVRLVMLILTTAVIVYRSTINIFVRSLSPQSYSNNRRIHCLISKHRSGDLRLHDKSKHQLATSLFVSNSNDNDLPTSSTSPEDSVLLDWITNECGGEGLDSITILSSQDGTRRRRGVYATKSIDAGSIIFEVPLSAALVIEETETSDAERGLKLLELLFDDDQQDQKWQTYRNSLPTQSNNYDPTPDFRTEDEIRRLEFPRLVNQALERKKRIKTLAATDAQHKIEELQFATWLVESRSLTLLKEPYPDCPEDLLQTTSIMIPVVDMINHDSHTPNSELQVVLFEDEGEEDGSPVSYAVIALDEIKEGDEVTISYGTGEESSVELLQYYGFVPESNDYDMDMLELCIDDDGNDVEVDDDCLIRIEDWSTTLEEDEKRLKVLSEKEDKDNRVEKTICQFRIRLKRAWNELQEEWDAADDEGDEDDGRGDVDEEN